MAIKTFRAYLRDILPPWLLGELSGGFTDVVVGYVHDALTEAATFARAIGWVKEDAVTVDSLPHLGRNFNLQRYPIETPGQFITRMQGAWDLWQFAGHEATIENQLHTLGFTGATVYDASECPGRAAGYWSIFWVFFPEGTHPILGPGPLCGSAGDCGGGAICGPLGLNNNELTTIRKIVRDWKPVDWICGALIFELLSPTCGADGDCGGGEVCGGVTVEVSPG